MPTSIGSTKSQGVIQFATRISLRSSQCDRRTSSGGWRWSIPICIFCSLSRAEPFDQQGIGARGLDDLVDRDALVGGVREPLVAGADADGWDPGGVHEGGIDAKLPGLQGWS